MHVILICKKSTSDLFRSVSVCWHGDAASYQLGVLVVRTFMADALGASVARSLACMCYFKLYYNVICYLVLYVIITVMYMHVYIYIYIYIYIYTYIHTYSCIHICT